jgi:hypothetical protein
MGLHWRIIFHAQNTRPQAEVAAICMATRPRPCEGISPRPSAG